MKFGTDIQVGPMINCNNFLQMPACYTQNEDGEHGIYYTC